MLRWLWLSALVIALDQLTKRLIDASMDVYQSIALLPSFQLTYLRNQGAAFSFLAQAGGWQRWFFIALAVAASAFICHWLYRLERGRCWEAAAWALILGGALGNLIDRIVYGYVIDFLDVYYGEWHWPAFNVADSAITVGVALLLIDAVRPRRSVAGTDPEHTRDPP
ncbi:signal peptidase II [Candidatus Methylocalor cossyra]|uniref:Lipoprotein signal peptidase n=1 Tax=Candidatus Methylocalor cossyra TaxID=3108543 RepID=A0ABM9NMA1_9GAMM